MTVSLLQAQCFDEVVRRRSFRSAGKVLGLSQPSVSTHVANLERVLGVTLLDRSSRGTRLTPDGARLVPFIRQLLAAEESLRDEGAALRGAPRSRVSVISVRAGLTSALPHAFSQLRQQFPDIVLTAEQASTPEVLAGVLAGDYDVGLLAHQGERPATDLGVDTDLVGSSLLGVCAPLGHRVLGSGGRRRQSIAAVDGASAVDERPVSPAVLAGEPLVVTAEGTAIRTVTDALLGLPTAPSTTTIACTVGDADMAVAVVAAGLGIAVIPRARALADAPGLGWRPLGGSDVVGMSVVRLRGGPRNRAAAALVDVLISPPGRTDVVDG